MNDPCIKLSVLRKLPRGDYGHDILDVKPVPTMDETMVEAVVVMWTEKGELRMAHFALESGEYLGDCIRVSEGKWAGYNT